MPKVTRRQALATTSALFASTCLAPLSKAISPFDRASASPLKLSLAAYSMRKYLPDTRRNPDATAAMDMLGFVDYASTLGIDAVELTGYFLPHPLTDERINALKLRAHIHGLDISGGAIGNNFTHAPGSEEGRRQMKATRYWIDQYAKLGAPVIRVFGGKPNKNTPEKQAISNIIANMNLACDYAAEKGVMLGMENHDFLTTIDRMLPIVEAISSPWFGVNFDSGNIAPTDDPYRELARIAPYAINAQIKVDIPINGKKVPTNLPRVIQILKDANYKGYITLEYEDHEEPRQAIPPYLSQLRSLLR